MSYCKQCAKLESENAELRQIIADTYPVIDDALNYFYPSRHEDGDKAMDARARLFALRDKLKALVAGKKRGGVKSNPELTGDCTATHLKYGKHKGNIKNILLSRWPSKEAGDVFFWRDRSAFPSLVKQMIKEGWSFNRSEALVAGKGGVGK